MEKTNRSTIILFRGHMGTGKTMFSDVISTELRAAVLHKDDIYDAAAKYVDKHQVRNKISYEILFNVLETTINNNSDLVIDYSYHRSEDMDNLRSWLSEKKVMFKSILCICSDKKMWAQRLKSRAEIPKPNQLITDLDSLKRHHGNLVVQSLNGELVIDTAEKNRDLLIKKIIDYISSDEVVSL